MKTALITTCVNPPRILELVRRYNNETRFFVALERDAPESLGDCVLSIPNSAVVIGDIYKCSPIIGWRTIQRRNVALLSALKWGAEVIISVDDDNVPLGWGWHGVHPDSLTDLPLITPLETWFNPGSLLLPPVVARGIPFAPTAWEVSFALDARVGVMQGLSLGDPDISAIERISKLPTAHQVSELARGGVLFRPAPYQWTVFNTQFTAFTRELAPALFCPPGVGRYDDILASLITQCVMRERGLCIYFGPPFAWQQRNPHNYVQDLKQELWGYEKIERVAEQLDAIVLKDESVMEQCRWIWDYLQPYVPAVSVAAALAFLDDCEKVL